MRKEYRLLIPVLSILFIINSCLGAYYFINYLDIANTEWNPSPPQDTWNFTVTYPPQQTGSGGLIYFTNSSRIIAIDVNLTGITPVIADSPYYIEAVGSAEWSFLRNITRITVGFNGAEPYEIPSGIQEIGGSFGGVTLYPQANISIPLNMGAEFGNSGLLGQAEKIDFPQPDTYTLTIQILYTNFTAPLVLTYPDQTVSVNPSNYFDSQRESRYSNAANTMTTIDILAGSVAAFIAVMRKASKKKTKPKTQSESKPTPSKPNTKPTINRPKTPKTTQPKKTS
jgi:hypothetical protein